MALTTKTVVQSDWVPRMLNITSFRSSFIICLMAGFLAKPFMNHRWGVCQKKDKHMERNRRSSPLFEKKTELILVIVLSRLGESLVYIFSPDFPLIPAGFLDQTPR